MTKSVVAGWRTPVVVIIAGCLIAMIGFGARSTFGLYLDPLTATRGWTRETFSLALAIQNLMWGICLPIAGACLLYTSPSPRDRTRSRMPSSA